MIALALSFLYTNFYRAFGGAALQKAERDTCSVRVPARPARRIQMQLFRRRLGGDPSAHPPYIPGDLTTGPPGKTLFFFMIPILIGNIFQQCYNLADSIIVGQFVGAGALAAVGGAGPIFYMGTIVSSGFSVGVAIVTGQFFGEGRRREIKDILSTSVLFTVATSILISILGVLFAPDLLRFLNTPEDVFADSVTYLTIIFVGFLFIFLANIGGSLFNALGDSKTPLYCMAAGGLLNIVLNLWFVIGFGWGVFGVALATVIGQVFTCAIGFPLLMRRIARLGDGQIGLRHGFGRFRADLLGLIVKLGASSALQGIVLSVSGLLIQGIINSFGSLYMAAYTSAQKIELFLTLPIYNLHNALSNYSAQNIGAGRLNRVKQGYRVSILWSMIFCAAMAVILFLFGGNLIGIFIKAESDGAVIQVGAQYLRMLCIAYFPMSFMFMSEGLLRGAGDVLAVSFITAGGMLFRMIAAYSFASLLGFYTVAVAYFFSYTSESILAYIRVRSGRWREKAVTGGASPVAEGNAAL